MNKNVTIIHQVLDMIICSILGGFCVYVFFKVTIDVLNALLPSLNCKVMPFFVKVSKSEYKFGRAILNARLKHFTIFKIPTFVKHTNLLCRITTTPSHDTIWSLRQSI